MSGGTKIWLVTAVILVVAGGIIFTAAMSAYNWDFSKLDTTEYETAAFEISNDFGDVKIDTDTADIVFCMSDDGSCRVVCYGDKKTKYSAEANDGTLTVKCADERKWYEHIGIVVNSPKITVYFPKAEYGSLSVKESTGNIEIPQDFVFESAKIKVSTGDILFSPSKCGTAEIKTSTGDICLKNVAVLGKLSVETDTGDVKFDSSDAAEISVKTDTGDVTGTLLSEKIFITETSTGDIKVPKTTTGGKCEITTSTGDIKLMQIAMIEE